MSPKKPKAPRDKTFGDHFLDALSSVTGVPAPRDDGERVKVLLSVSKEDLAEIDRRADEAGMSRSAYLVAMGKRGAAPVFEAIQKLETELKRFQADNTGWRTELTTLQREIDQQRERMLYARRIAAAVAEIMEQNTSLSGDNLPACALALRRAAEQLNATTK